MLRQLRHKLTTVAAIAMIAAGIGVAATSAFAASDSKTTTANVAVNSLITLSGLTPAFTLTGDPSATVTAGSAVTMNVTTNSLTGYNVSVQAAADHLQGAPSNTQTIPIGNLKVKGDLATYTSVSNLTPFVVHAQATMSAASGDTLTNAYQVAIPFVPADTYSVQLNYVATAL